MYNTIDFMREINHQSIARQNFSARTLTSIRVAVFLASRDIKRANIWTTLLIIFVMTATFLNLVVVGGILVGLIEGSVSAQKDRYTGDIIISRLPQKDYIERSQEMINYINSFPEVESVTARYIEGGKIEANYKTKIRQSDITDSAGALITGISPSDEDAVTGISDTVIEGSYLGENDYDQILIGANLLYKYTPVDTPSMKTLPDVEAGTKVRLIFSGISREMTVKGILKSKVGEVDSRIFMNSSQLRNMIGRTDQNVAEIAIRLTPGSDAMEMKNILIAAQYDSGSKIQTSIEAQPKFLQDMKATFGLLGDVIGSIGLVVASITIFIIIFVNAITRRKFIGIMKGIGINSIAIELSYVIQAMFYGTLGSGIGIAVVFLILKPFFNAYPINFPFSDGILVATTWGVGVRVVILMIATIIAGYIPAKIVSRQNTLDAILGR